MKKVNEILYKNNLFHYLIISFLIFLYTITMFNESKNIIIFSSINIALTTMVVAISFYLKYLFRNNNDIVIALYFNLLCLIISCFFINEPIEKFFLKMTCYVTLFIMTCKMISYILRIFKIYKKEKENNVFLRNSFNIFNTNENYLYQYYSHKINSMIKDDLIFINGEGIINLHSFINYLEQEKIDHKKITEKDVEIYQMQII